MQAARAMLMIAALLLPASLPAQVFEIGNDGVMRAAPGMATGKRGGPSSSDAEAVRPRMDGPAAATGWIVQLGAYESGALRDAAWQDMRRRHGDLLEGRHVLHSEAVVRSRRYFRLGLAGFEDRHAATAMCQALRERGDACFVKSRVL